MQDQGETWLNVVLYKHPDVLLKDISRLTDFNFNFYFRKISLCGLKFPLSMAHALGFIILQC